MKSSEAPESARPKRRLRLTLRWLLVLAAVVPALAGFYIKRLIVNRNALGELAAIAPQSTRSLVEYDFQVNEDGMSIPNAISSVPRPLVSLFGHSFFHDVVGVCLDGERVAITDLQTLRSLPRLKRLDVEYNSVSAEFLRTIGQLSGLERLDLQETGIRDDDLTHISSLENLRAVLLSGPGISDKGLVHLRRMSRLEHVVLHDCAIQGAGLVHLAGSRALRSLDLRKCPVSDDAIDVVCAFGQLEALNLSGAQLSDAGVRKLVALGKLSQLQLPWAVSDQAVACLVEALPGCKVERNR
jgi:hypothetical protein